MILTKLPISLALVGAAIVAGSAVEPGTSVTTLPTVVVRGSAAGGSLTIPTIDEKASDLRRIPGGAGLVDGRVVREGRATTLKDALDFAPGVFAQPRFGAEEARLSIRGSGLQRTFHGRGIKLLQDGVPLNLGDGGFDFRAVDPLTARYIEVYRGANALEFGASTLGGAINYVSFNGRDDPGFGVRGEIGSFGAWRSQLYGAGAVGPLDYYLSLSSSVSEGYRDHSRQENVRAVGNVGYSLGDEVETRFYFSYVHTDSELPGDLTKRELDADPTRAARNAFVPNFDRVDSNWKRDFELFRISNRTTWKGDSAQVTLGSFYAHKNLDHPILFVIDQRSDDAGADLRYDGSGSLFGLTNELTVGIGASVGQTDDTRFVNDLGSRGTLFGDVDQLSTNGEFYLRDSLYLADSVALVVGGQIAYARRENDDNLAGRAGVTGSSDTQDWWGYSPQAGLLWDVTADVQIYSNVSRSFEPPSFGELTAPATGGFGLVDLDAQTATTLEFGTRGDVGRIRWDLGYYHAWLDGELITQSVAPGLTQTVNAGRTVHRGIEFEIGADVLTGIAADGDRLRLRQNYLFSDFRFDGDDEYGDNPIAGIPRHYLRTELVYEHPSGFYCGPNLEWVPQGYSVDHANTLGTDGYALFGFKVGYRKDSGFSFYIDARNLTDETYAATTGVIGTAGEFNSAQFSPGDGRSVYVGVEYRF